MEFHGIPPEAFVYFEQLRRHDDKDWWHAHRELWDEGVHGPLVALAADLESGFGPLSVSRPNRDIRLTKDTSPYRRYASISRTTERDAGLYLQVDAHGVLVAAGLWSPTTDQLGRFRDAVGDDRTAAALERTLAGLRRHRLPLGDGEPLRRAPRGWDADHPRIDLLRRTRLTVERRWAPAAWMRTGQLRRRVETAWRAAARWNDWLHDHVGGGSVEASASDRLDRRG